MIYCLLQFFQDHDWKDFRLAELRALLEMNGVDPTVAFQDACADAKDSSSIDGSKMGPDTEMDAVVKEHSLHSPYLKIRLPNEEVATDLCRRSVLIKHIYLLLGEGNDLPSLHSHTLQAPLFTAPPQPPPVLGDNLTPPQPPTWSLSFDCNMRSLTQEERGACIQAFPLPLPGSVALKNPDLSVFVLLDYSSDPSAADTTGGSKARVDKGEWQGFRQAFCGLLLGRGGMREALKKYDLKKRHYLGPTSLDPLLALLMGSVSRVRPGDLVLDPFVGTASILVAASHHGARCFGCDIDIRVLRGNMHAGVRIPTRNTSAAATTVTPPSNSVSTSDTAASKDGSERTNNAGDSDTPNPRPPKKAKRKKGECTRKTQGDIPRSLWDNFRAYGLPLPELVRMDLHLWDQHTRGGVVEGTFDAIITDPPYGIRAGAKKTGRSSGGRVVETADKRDDYIPATQAYQVEEVMLDLLHTAASALKMGGTLTYLIPAPYGTTAPDLPAHPCLRIEAICEQGLSTRHCRYLVAMRKHRVYGPAEREDYRQYSASVLRKESGAGFEMLIDKLRAALMADPLQCLQSQEQGQGAAGQSVVIQASKSSIKRKLNKEKRAQLQKEGKRGAPRCLTSREDSSVGGGG